MSPVKSAFLRTILRVPLFYKIMIANLAIMFAVSVVGATVAPRLVEPERLGMTLLFAFLGGIAVVVANAVILRLALHPLEALEDAAHRMSAGDLSMRASSSSLADRGMEELNRGAEIRIPRLMGFVLKLISPVYLLAVFCFEKSSASYVTTCSVDAGLRR